MSRSTRLPIQKDKPHFNYWRPIRSRQNQIVRGYTIRYDDSVCDLDDDESFDGEIDVIEKNSILLGTDIPNPKTIINDYDYCDSKWDFRFLNWDDCKIKYSRK